MTRYLLIPRPQVRPRRLPKDSSPAAAHLSTAADLEREGYRPEASAIGSAFPIETEISATRDTHRQPDVVFSDHGGNGGKMHVTYHTVDYIINEDFLHTVHARIISR